MTIIPDPKGSMFVIGLTGGIGTGKTEVSRILQWLGAEVIDADVLGHQAYKRGTDVWREVVDTYGECTLTADGEIDRGKASVLDSVQGAENSAEIDGKGYFSFKLGARCRELSWRERERASVLSSVHGAEISAGLYGKGYF